MRRPSAVMRPSCGGRKCGVLLMPRVSPSPSRRSARPSGPGISCQLSSLVLTGKLPLYVMFLGQHVTPTSQFISGALVVVVAWPEHRLKSEFEVIKVKLNVR